LPYLNTGSAYKSCCGKVICSGCIHAPVYDNQGNKVDNKKCPFCRTLAHKSINEEYLKRLKKRVEANDPIAIYNTGNYYRDGRNGFPQDYTKALELFHRAAELGQAEAYCNIGYLFEHGRGVERDSKKAAHYYELAAMRGDVKARHNLGVSEEKTGNMDRAIKHYTIAAKSGHSNSLIYIQDLYKDGHATKEDYTKALKLYQQYLGEIKSSQRDEAATAHEQYRYY